jgi:hypothetical protein
MFEPCPGCAAEFLPRVGPTHRYIGAHAGCWALYAEFLASGTASPARLRSSRVRPWTGHEPASRRDLGTLLVDAYAAQHHGTPSPAAIQSVAVHLLVLCGVLRNGLAVEHAQWARRRALRVRGVFRWLQPPERGASMALRQVFLEEGTAEGFDISAYVASVFDAWMSTHEAPVPRPARA